MNLRKPKTNNKFYVTPQGPISTAAPANAPKVGQFVGSQPPIGRGSVPASAAKKGKSKRAKKY
jgi:hypothetical protein